MSSVFVVRGVRYSYPGGREALGGVDLEVQEGETVVLLGPNGAGKSTLLLVMAGLLEPSSGEVLYRGRPLSGLRDPRRLEIGFLFQDPDHQLFSLTVFEDVAFGPRQMGLSEEEVAERVREALARVGLSGFEERSPHHLSFGEKRRVALATVLSMRPRVLLLDEPTSNLDPRARRRFVGLMRELPETKLIATHDLELAYEVADRVIFLYRGRATEAGDPRSALLDEELLHRFGLDMPLFARILKGEIHAREDRHSGLPP
ncbi:energy-coupling factor ABC transporter ATP-binding protein [Thermosulfurimonas sp. F29]|uniref:energy-coupling factor ABC transporter ATP-binding protein n=1 Tax=Thermosulfurimonas sp. F29 TaxID=2867247 RepID=UPI001C836756|nr:ABC transporter ATP-binding protein [Thermosulfurimonas sp. F29]MBX6422624.1 energy-coupling factor ABC transporter ATP-binding protein [Thermosulfurimonas sp. F29]